jgi:PhzF family phenazine biosynthesis protein
MNPPLKRYQVDAFAERIFTGNPAVVCPLESWLSTEVMQQIAMENNLSETAFYVMEGDGYRIRWFTPGVEVDLCGHATLAAAFVLFEHEGFRGERITFQSRSGPLVVSKSDGLLNLDFPADVISELKITPELRGVFDESVERVFKGKTDYLFVFETEDQIRNCKPDFSTIAKLPVRGVIITAKGRKVDFVSRFFGPQSGIDEDPVTGSAHTTLTPYWAGVLRKTKMEALQLSSRGGKLICELKEGRVVISGTAKLFSTGIIYLE